jgi:hypothetical protein
MHLTTDSENSGFTKIFTPVNLLIWALFSAFLLFRFWSSTIKSNAMVEHNGVLIAVMFSLFYIFWAFLNQWVLVMLAGLIRLSKPVGILCFLGYLYLISPAFLSRTGIFKIRFILAPMVGMIGAVIVSLIVGLFVKDPDGREGKNGDEKLASAIDHLDQHPVNQNSDDQDTHLTH